MLALKRIKGSAGATRIAALKAVPSKNDVPLYAHPPSEAIAALTKRAEEAERDHEYCKTVADRLRDELAKTRSEKDGALRLATRLNVGEALAVSSQREAEAKLTAAEARIEEMVLSHADLCRLSRVFCDATGPRTAQDIIINEWLKRKIAKAKGLGDAG